MTLQKNSLLLLATLFFTLVLTACGSTGSDPGNPPTTGRTEVPFEIVDDAPLPVESLRELVIGMPGVSALMHEDTLYLIATAGPQANTCYDLTVENVFLTDAGLDLDLRLLEPGPDDACGEAIVFPAVTIKIEEPPIAAGDKISHNLPENNMVRDGTWDLLHPLEHDRLRDVKVESTENGITVTGQARDIFEGHLQYSVLHEGWLVDNGVTLLDDSYGQWVDFEIELDRGDTVFLYTHSARDGSLEGVAVAQLDS